MNFAFKYKKITLWMVGILFTWSYIPIFANVVPTVNFAPHFHATIQPIPEAIKQQMIGVTWFSGCPVPLNELAYIRLNYWGFDNKVHMGELIVNKSLAPEVVKIFENVFAQHFPIASIKPLCQFKGNDYQAMEANNSSAFNCRRLLGSHRIYSLHAYGRAIDINPVMNPYVRGKLVLPKNARSYVNREKVYNGMITQNSSIYRDFKSQCWRWGGDWQNIKDYQHFDKPYR